MKKALVKVWEKSGPIARTVLDLWLFALGASASLSDSSCSSEASFFLLLRASALRMLERTLWCSGGSMLFTSSNLKEQQPKWCSAHHHKTQQERRGTILLSDVKTYLTQTFWLTLWRCFLVWSWSVSSHHLECFQCPPSEQSQGCVKWEHNYHAVPYKYGWFPPWLWRETPVF